MNLFKKKKKPFNELTLKEKWFKWRDYNDKTIDEYPEVYVAGFLGIEPEEVNRIKQEGFEDD